jgi:spore maturation protein CgeB
MIGMKLLFYTHSLISDWNHGNAHFLRGVMRELLRMGHQPMALEPRDSWSRRNLIADQGEAAVRRFSRDFPELVSMQYDDGFHHEAALDAADVVIVHEWTDPQLVARIGRARRRGGRFMLLFHDTHHRAVSAEAQMAALDLDGYDGILAFGAALREKYIARGWGRQVFVWHEAADDTLFRPIPAEEPRRDLIWIGNWGDDERSKELAEFLIDPARQLGLTGSIRGVRYPQTALTAIRSTGLVYGGWIANADVPAAFARHRVTVHVPRQPYTVLLPGIPTIRVFEALACGIPLVSAPWRDDEQLFRPGQDFLIAKNGAEMAAHLSAILHDEALADHLVSSGLQTIRDRHTCRHRAEELLKVLAQLDAPSLHHTRLEQEELS